MHACAVRFDVMRNLKKILEVNKVLLYPIFMKTVFVAHPMMILRIKF